MNFLNIEGLKRFLAQLLTKVVAAINEVAEQVTIIKSDYLSKNGKAATAGNADTATRVKNALSISLNGGAATTYDGSAARTINITPVAIGTVPTFNLGQLGGNINYTVFAKMLSGNTAANGSASFLVSDAGNYGGVAQGIWFVQISNRGNKPSMNVVTLLPQSGGTVTFGYYTSGTEFCYGVYTTEFRGNCSITTLQNAGATIKDYGDVATTPSGWVAVTAKTLADTGHNHDDKYLKITGIAASADKLNTSAGSASKPVYFNGGKPTACTYELNATVPSGAKFTDTVYTHPLTSGNKHIPSGGSAGQILRWSADGTAQWGADNNTTYTAATQTKEGLMSAADKKKVDNMAEFVDLTETQITSLLG